MHASADSASLSSSRFTRRQRLHVLIYYFSRTRTTGADMAARGCTLSLCILCRYIIRPHCNHESAACMWAPMLIMSRLVHVIVGSTAHRARYGAPRPHGRSIFGLLEQSKHVIVFCSIQQQLRSHVAQAKRAIPQPIRTFGNFFTVLHPNLTQEAKKKKRRRENRKRV